MDGLVKLDEQLSILTRPPSEADLEQLAGEVRSVVNLRAPGEKNEVLTPEEEGEEAREHGLSYLSSPVSPADLNAQTVARVGAELDDLPGPVAVHCATGRRASLIALAHWARQHGADAREAAGKARAAGLNVTEADLQPLIGAGAAP